MRNIQTIKGGLGVLALAFAASLLLLLPGCQGPLGPDRAAPETGTVRLALEMPPVGRAILPQITLDDFDYFRLAFTSGPDTYTARWDGTDGTIDLAAGDWYLVVTAYLTGYHFDDDDYLLYSGPAIPVNVVPGAVSDVDVSLNPVLLTGDGTFIWNVTVPVGTATLTVRNLNNIVVGMAPIASGVEDSMSLPAGRYNVLIRVVSGNEVAVLGKPLFVLPYREMPSRLDHEFEAGHFRALASGTLGGFISRTGDGWAADPGWVNTPITEGAFTSGDELNDNGLPLEWVNNDGALSLRVAGRTQNHHGVDLMVEGLGLEVGDRIYVTGRVVSGAVEAGNRVMFANADPADHVQLAQGPNLGLAALDHVPLGLPGFVFGPVDGTLPEVIRIQTNGWGLPAGTVAHGIHTFYIDGITINRITPFSGPLSDIVSFTGLLAGAERPAWYTDEVSAGAAVSAPFSFDGPGATWIEHNGYLSVRQANRTENHHRIVLSLAGLALLPGDTVTVTGRAYDVVAVSNRQMRMNFDTAAAPGGGSASSIGADATGTVPFTLSAAFGAAIPAEVRIQVDNWSDPAVPGGGVPTVVVDTIVIYRPAVAAITGTLGGFVRLTGGMPTDLAWQSAPIVEGGVVPHPFPAAPNNLMQNAGSVLTWINVGGNLALQVTGRNLNWNGVDLRLANLGFTATGVYSLTITGVMATAAAGHQMVLGREPWDSAGWVVSAGAVTPDAADGAFTLTAPSFAVANFGTGASDFRIQTNGAAADEPFVITDIVFARIGTTCAICGAHPCPPRPCGNHHTECICYLPDAMFRLTDWLVGPPAVTSIGFGTVPLSCTAGGNVSIVDNGLVVGLAAAWDGVEFSSPGDVVVFDFTSNQYYIEVTGNIVGAHTGPIVIGMAGGGAINSIGTSGALTGPDAPFTVSGYINSTTFPLAGNHIRIRADSGATSFRIDEIVITQVAATDAMLIAAAQEFGQAAVGTITPSVDVTAGMLLSAVRDVIPNTDIIVAWGTPGFNLVPPVGAAPGSITGTIVLTLNGLTENVNVALVIPGAVDGYVFNMNELLTAADVEAHFGGHNNRGIVSVTGTPGAWVVTGDRLGQGTGGSTSLADSMNNGWSLIHLLAPGQVAASDQITVRFSILRDGVPFAMDNSPIWWDPSTSGNATGGQEAENSGVAISSGNNTAATPAGGRTMTFSATPEIAENGLSLRWNSWNTGANRLTDPDTQAGFAFVIYEAFVER